MKLLATQRGFCTILGRGRVFTLPWTFFSKILGTSRGFQGYYSILNLPFDCPYQRIWLRQKRKNLIWHSALVLACGIFAYYWGGVIGYLSLIFRLSAALTIAYIFFLFCCNSLVLLYLVSATKILHYTDTNFTLFYFLEDIVEIACPCSVLTLSADLFHKLPFFQALDCRVYRFLIYIAFLRDQPPWRKATVFLSVAMADKATVDGKFLWL